MSLRTESFACPVIPSLPSCLLNLIAPDCSDTPMTSTCERLPSTPTISIVSPTLELV